MLKKEEKSQQNDRTKQSRPRLVRAMSAPCHPKSLEDQPQTTKKRNRRKKIAPIECVQVDLRASVRQSFQKTRTVSIDRKVEVVKSGDRRALTARNRVKSSKVNAALPRPKHFVHTNDIVTLVSLLSPGTSDSEKEENSLPKNETERAPSLRKTGKSVSFQDDTDTFREDEPPSEEIRLSPMVRRASFVPLASNIRLNRPPTAPPGSIFMKPFG